MAKVGEYLLLGDWCLASVTELLPTGFKFDCVNGNWVGSYNSETSELLVGNVQRQPGVAITSSRQPPRDVRRGGYNAIMPWMRENP